MQISFYIQDSPIQQRESPDHDADDYEEMQMERRGSFIEDGDGDEDVYQNYWLMYCSCEDMQPKDVDY